MRAQHGLGGAAAARGEEDVGRGVGLCGVRRGTGRLVEGEQGLDLPGLPADGGVATGGGELGHRIGEAEDVRGPRCGQCRVEVDERAARLPDAQDGGEQDEVPLTGQHHEVAGCPEVRSRACANRSEAASSRP
ncbi:hypothetical protein SANTM175S_04350 [Streptomyces antimycoticus]